MNQYTSRDSYFSVYVNILRIICKRLQNANIIWAITGSFGHALQGISIIPSDIDIICSKKAAYKIEELFKEYIVKKIEFSSLDTMRSYFGILQICGVKIEIIGDIENYINGEIWEPHIDWHKNIHHIMVSNIFIPVLSVEYEYEVYKKLNQVSRLELLREKIENTRC